MEPRIVPSTKVNSDTIDLKELGCESQNFVVQLAAARNFIFVPLNARNEDFNNDFVGDRGANNKIIIDDKVIPTNVLTCVSKGDLSSDLKPSTDKLSINDLKTMMDGLKKSYAQSHVNFISEALNEQLLPNFLQCEKFERSIVLPDEKNGKILLKQTETSYSLINTVNGKKCNFPVNIEFTFHLVDIKLQELKDIINKLNSMKDFLQKLIKKFPPESEEYRNITDKIKTIESHIEPFEVLVEQNKDSYKLFKLCEIKVKECTLSIMPSNETTNSENGHTITVKNALLGKLTKKILLKYFLEADDIAIIIINPKKGIAHTAKESDICRLSEFVNSNNPINYNSLSHVFDHAGCSEYLKNCLNQFYNGLKIYYKEKSFLPEFHDDCVVNFKHRLESRGILAGSGRKITYQDISKKANDDKELESVINKEGFINTSSENFILSSIFDENCNLSSEIIKFFPASHHNIINNLILNIFSIANEIVCDLDGNLNIGEMEKYFGNALMSSVIQKSGVSVVKNYFLTAAVQAIAAAFIALKPGAEYIQYADLIKTIMGTQNKVIIRCTDDLRKLREKIGIKSDDERLLDTSVTNNEDESQQKDYLLKNIYWAMEDTLSLMLKTPAHFSKIPQLTRCISKITQLSQMEVDKELIQTLKNNLVMINCRNALFKLRECRAFEDSSKKNELNKIYHELEETYNELCFAECFDHLEILIVKINNLKRKIDENQLNVNTLREEMTVECCDLALGVYKNIPDKYLNDTEDNKSANLKPLHNNSKNDCENLYTELKGKKDIENISNLRSALLKQTRAIKQPHNPQARMEADQAAEKLPDTSLGNKVKRGFAYLAWTCFIVSLVALPFTCGASLGLSATALSWIVAGGCFAIGSASYISGSQPTGATKSFKALNNMLGDNQNRFFKEPRSASSSADNTKVKDTTTPPRPGTPLSNSQQV